MRNKIVKIGRIRLIALITLFSIIASVLISVLCLKLFNKEIDFLTMAIAILAPAIIAPTATWHIVDLMIKVSQLEEEMRRHATFDILTGVMTRRAFMTECENIYHSSRNNKSSLSLVYIDIDNFKNINDTYGHIGGDVILEAFGSMISHCKREHDLVGRIGGEEFVLALPDTDLQSAIGFSNKIRLLAKNSMVQYANKTIGYTVSIGVASYNQENKIDLEQLIKQADDALYRAKHLGKNCVIEYKAN